MKFSGTNGILQGTAKGGGLQNGAMRPLREKDVAALGNRLELTGWKFFDEFKIGLTLKSECLMAPPRIDLRKSEKQLKQKKVNVRRKPLLPNRFYLGFSNERFRLPPNVFGFLHTRS